MKIAIVGSRNFSKDIVHTWMAKSILYTDLIISGGATGVDTYAIEFAKANGISYIEFLPKWDKYGKLAGAIRNKDIVKTADQVVAFWDGKSKGTKITIDMAKAANKPLEIIYDHA